MRFQNATRADARLRAALAPDTRLRPDAYAGADAAELKRAAEDAVLAVHPEAVLRRAILAAPNWTDEAPGVAASGRRPAVAGGSRRADPEHHETVLGGTAAGTRADGRVGPAASRALDAIPMLEENAR
jgi:hypothetical protein